MSDQFIDALKVEAARVEEEWGQFHVKNGVVLSRWWKLEGKVEAINGLLAAHDLPPIGDARIGRLTR